MGLRDIAKRGTKRVGRAFGFSDVENKLNRIEYLLDESREKNLKELDERLESLKDSFKERETELASKIKRLEKINELYFQALFKKSGESDLEMRKRFYLSLPKAEGDLRLFQLGNAKLLKKLTSICDKNNLTYFLQSGTLLGAVRHEGFIPWDDDTDVAMFRDDIAKLFNILKNDKNYKLSLIYDYSHKSRQIRFRTTNSNNPCFLDVYIYDYGDDANDAAWKKWHENKEKIVKKFEEENPEIISEWRKTPWVEDDSKLGKKIRPLYEKYYDSLLKKNKTKSSYSAVCWGLDNFSVKWKRLFEKEMIFPTAKLKYEGLSVAAPKDYERYLIRQYGDYYKLPEDLVSHYQHIDHGKIDSVTIRNFLDE